MPVSFDDHVALLTTFIDRQHDIVGRIESGVLNVQGKDPARTRNRDAVDKTLHACFFDPQQRQHLRGQLTAAHLADGFEPVRAARLDPADLAVRACDYWDSHRWPGRNGRVAYARRLYAVFVFRQLEQLSLRIWDDSVERASGRLAQLQSLLDRLNAGTSPELLLRDAHWLIQTAQGALTRQLAPYFRTAERIAASLTEPERLAVHKAGARLAGGHLRSQHRYRMQEDGKAIDDAEVLAVTRNSNAMDGALLVRDLVFLLAAYQSARAAGDADARMDLADAILQGLSADPGLLLVRLDLLGPSTTVEDVFVERGPDGMRYTDLGKSHIELLARYGQLIGALAGHLKEDAAMCSPDGRPYSPFGIAYGFCADILANMALDTLMSQPSALSLEDTFDSSGDLEQKRLRAQRWAKLPARPQEREHFEYSAEWAAQVFRELTHGLEARAANGPRANGSSLPAARLFVVRESQPVESLPDGLLPAGIVSAQDHCVTSDVTRAFATGATAFPKSQIAVDRREGRFLASVDCDGTWFGVSKAILTMCTAQGKDALITGVPDAVVEVLRVTCPELIVVG
jgi:hypothetical protein